MVRKQTYYDNYSDAASTQLSHLGDAFKKISPVNFCQCGCVKPENQSINQSINLRL